MLFLFAKLNPRRSAQVKKNIRLVRENKLKIYYNTLNSCTVEQSNSRISVNC